MLADMLVQVREDGLRKLACRLREKSVRLAARAMWRLGLHHGAPRPHHEGRGLVHRAGPGGSAAGFAGEYT